MHLRDLNVCCDDELILSLFTNNTSINPQEVIINLCNKLCILLCLDDKQTSFDKFIAEIYCSAEMTLNTFAHPVQCIIQ